MLYLALYDNFFFVVLVLLLVFASIKYKLRGLHDFRLVVYFEMLAIFFVTALASWFISVRPPEVEGDTSVYLDFFQTIIDGTGEPFAIFEPGFAIITLFLSSVGLDLRVLFFFVPMVLSLSYHRLAIQVLGARSSLTILVFVCILIYPFFLSLTANVIRQGLAMAFVLFAISSLLRGGKWQPRMVAITSFLFHKSTVILLPWVFFRRLCANVPVSLIVMVWFCASIASYLGVFKVLAIGLFDQLASLGLSINYGDTSSIDYVTGFRLSFWLFSSCSILFLVMLRVLGFKNDKMVVLFKMSAYFGIVHIFTFDMAYNDRFGLYVWMLYPLQIPYLVRCLLALLSRSVEMKGEGSVFH